jgi:signal transduction histidine kinase
MNKKPFISIRWKLVSTYLLLIFLSLLLINSFVNASLTKYLIDEKKDALITQANIISDRVAPNYYALNKEYTFDYIKSIIKNLSLQLDSRVIILDDKGIVLIDSYDDFVNSDFSYIDEVASALEGVRSAQAYQFADVGKTLYISVPIVSEAKILGAVFMSSSPLDVFHRIETVSKNFLMLSIGSVIITVIVSFVFVDILSAPILSLTDSVRQVSLGNTSERARIYSNDEMGNLSEAFNIMVTKLNQVDDQRKRFVSNVSHELRTPLTSVKIIAETLMTSNEENPEVYKDFLSDVNSEVDRLNKIIDSLLYLVDLEKKELELEYSVTYVNYLIRRVIDMIKPIADQKHIELHYEDTDRVQIVLDQLKIRQCLINIINNAIKYSPPHKHIFITLSTTLKEVSISVKDEGMGIPKEDIPYIFDRFYRVDTARARHTGGSGLGLSIVQQIIQLHLGRIEVQSEQHVGSIFTLILPKKQEM